MSAAFLSGCTTYFPNAQIVYDKFHIIQEANKVLDEVRKMEKSEKKLLKGQRLTLLHLRKNLPDSKLSTLDTILYGSITFRVENYVCNVLESAVSAT